MSLRFEAWTLPWSSDGFKRLIADLPVEGGTGTVRFNDFGEGSITLPADYDRLDTVISSTTGSLIRVYDDSKVVHEFLAERVARDVDDAATVEISGAGLESMFDRTVVYPYDYPTNPPTVPDWVYGGANQLSNGGFENNAVTPLEYQLTIDATGGTFTLSDGTDTTSNIAYDASASTIQTRIETDISAISDVAVASTGGSFIITYVTPQFSPTLSINTGGLTGGSATFGATQDGGYSPSGWQKAAFLVNGLPQNYGNYDNFGVSDVQAHSGSLSLLVDPGPVTATGNRNAGAQQVVSVDPGGTYQASVWVYPTSSTDEFRLGIFGVGEEQIAFDSNGVSGGTLTQNTWNELTIADVSIPSDVDQIIFRVQCTNEGPSDPSVFYIDDAELNEGLAESTVGTIVAGLMDDATSDHSGDTRGTILTWVDYSGFDATNDSTSEAWDDSLSFTVSRGMSYGQVWDRLAELGYEWRLTPKSDTDTYAAGADTHDLNWYNPDNAGTDHTVNSTPSITGGTNVTGGPVVERIPDYTAVLVEGDDVFVEDKDSTAETNFGRFEKYHSDRGLASTTSATAAGDALLSLESNNRTAVKVDIVATPDHPRPLVDYTVGDTLYFQLPPVLARTSRRVRQVSWRVGEPDEYTVMGSRVFPGEEGGWEALRLLIRRFEARQRETPSSPSIGGSSGGAPTVVVAADDATELSKVKADFLCDGTDDHVEIQAALDLMTSGGRLVLTEGTFSVSTDEISLSGDTHLMGMNRWDATVLSYTGSGTVVTVADDCTVSDLTISPDAGGES